MISFNFFFFFNRENKWVEKHQQFSGSVYYYPYQNLKLPCFLNLILSRKKSSYLYMHLSFSGMKVQSRSRLKEGIHNFGTIFLIVTEESFKIFFQVFYFPKEDYTYFIFEGCHIQDSILITHACCWPNSVYYARVEEQVFIMNKS